MFSGSIGFDIPPDYWKKEFADSKFALIIRGDTPGSHSFYNSISLGCIPVVISHGFKIFSLPFQNKIKLEDFAVEFEEDYFINHPEKIMPDLNKIPDEVIKSKLEKLKEIQKMLLYNHPESQVADLILEQFQNIHPDLFK